MQNQASDTSIEETSGAEKPPKKIPSNSLALQFAGDLVLVKKPDIKLIGFYKRYEAIFESCANADRTERLLRYKFLTALILTSYAKKEIDREKRRELFDKKNKLFFDIANSQTYRPMVAFKYLVSKNFRVLKYCDSCLKENTESGLEKHKWKYCKNCTIDRNFYNVLSMFHRFDKGSFSIYLSNELLSNVKLKNPKKHIGKIDDYKEQGKYQLYTYNVKNLDSIRLDSTLKLYDKIIGR